MKITIKYLCIALLSIITLTSCGASSDKKKTEETTISANLETVSLAIEGMTCEIGCAKTIESKISKMEGVTESKVDFEAKKGTFTYDTNKTTEATIVTTINGLLDGKTYTASKTETCCAVKEVKTCTKECAEKCGHKVGETCEKCDVNKTKVCTKECAEKCGHKVGETCDKCAANKEACSKSCAEKCEHKTGEHCKMSDDKKIDGKPGCEKACCSTKTE